MSNKIKENLSFYEEISDKYDQVISWQERFDREKSFFSRLFSENNINSLLDAGCATGAHAIEFARSGLEVYGADFSPEMIEEAKKNAKAKGVSAEFFVSNLFDVSKHIKKPVDLVMSIGTTLPQLLSEEKIAETFSSFYSSLKKGGTLLVQNVNFEKMYAKNTRFRPPKYYRDGNKDKFFLRTYNFVSRSELYVDMVTLVKDGDKVEMLPHTVNMRPMYVSDITRYIQRAGFGEVSVYGGYDLSAYDEKSSPDLVVIAQKE